MDSSFRCVFSSIGLLSLFVSLFISSWSGCRYAMGCTRRGHRRSHDHWALHERNWQLSKTFHGAQFCCKLLLISCMATFFQRYLLNCSRKVFLGQKYGYRPIPTYILASELAQFREVLLTMGQEVILLDTWYKKDSNAVPPVCILQPISSILVNFNNKVTISTT